MQVTLNGTNRCQTSITDVVQVYVVDPSMLSMDQSMPILVRYWKRLVAFRKLVFQPGQSTAIQVDVRFDDIAIYVDEAMEKFQLVAGEYTVRVGNSSRTDSLTATVVL